jgi:HD-GYP domain-containing protein (c-di-GMP phosphodiesterase class II)
MLSNHTDTQLYFKSSDAKDSQDSFKDAFSDANDADADDVDAIDESKFNTGDTILNPEKLASVENLKVEVPEDVRIFKAEVEKELKSIFVFLADPQAKDSDTTLKSMELLTDKVLKVVAPDVDDLRGSILKNSKYLMVMADSAAITSIAVLLAMAHGFDSKKIFRDLSTAILLMDTALAEVPEEMVLRYYRDRESLDQSELELIKAHPQKAFQAVSKKLKALPESVLQLILNHHENYNATGYPRGLRNEQLPPIIRSLNLAVNVFEIMKRETLKGNNGMDLLKALEELKELDVEAHKRKHNQNLVNKAIRYISSPN